MKKEIIWLSSYPKSGNTWIRTVLCTLLYSKNYNFNFEILRNIVEFDIPANYEFLKKNNNQEFNNLNNINVISKYWLEAQKIFNSKSKTKIFKTHSANISYLRKNYTDKNATKGLIYIIRDPRDVAISYSKHINKNIDEVIDFMQRDNAITYSAKGRYPIILSRWDYHIKSWHRLEVPKLFIKYEDILENTATVVRLLIKFLNNKLGYSIKLDATKIDEVILNTSFEKMRKQEQADGFSEASKYNAFFRKGKKEQWKELLNKNQISEITKAFKNAMIKFDYY